MGSFARISPLHVRLGMFSERAETSETRPISLMRPKARAAVARRACEVDWPKKSIGETKKSISESNFLYRYSPLP